MNKMNQFVANMTQKWELTESIPKSTFFESVKSFVLYKKRLPAEDNIARNSLAPIFVWFSMQSIFTTLESLKSLLKKKVNQRNKEKNYISC